MKFIKLTYDTDKRPIYLNISNIISISKYTSYGTIIYSTGGENTIVSESPEDIIDTIKELIY